MECVGGYYAKITVDPHKTFAMNAQWECLHSFIVKYNNIIIVV